MERYLHISFDDVIALFEDLSQSNYESLFDQPFLKILYDLHDKYDAKFSLYCFFQNGDGSFGLNDCTSRYKYEFSEASGWLKFGFHAYSQWQNIIDEKPNVLLEQYNQFNRQILRITGSYKCIDPVIRVHRFDMTKKQMKKLANAEHNITGLFLAEDYEKFGNFSLKKDEWKEINNVGNGKNKYGITYYPSNIRLDKYVSEKKKINILDYYKNTYLELYLHESSFYDNRENMENLLNDICVQTKNEFIVFYYLMNLYLE